jgi:uncharacterized repeat protein (TIGR03803 family)
MPRKVQRKCPISRIGVRATSTSLALAVMFVLAVVAPQSAQAQTFSVLYSFMGGTDGVSPSGLVRDAAGNLYGTTSYYGGNGCYYCGTVFKLNKNGKETVLYSFTGGKDGGSPESVFRDAAGNLYGTTYSGGDLTCNAPNGCGTVFEVGQNGQEKALFSFNGHDGAYPGAGLIRDAAGNFYGTTYGGGGTSQACPKTKSCGVVFKLNKTGGELVLYRFAGGTDGADPVAVIQDGAGNIYGTTSLGGTYHAGTVFKLDKNGQETVLYSFSEASGGGPDGGLVRDAAGNLYGTTAEGGDLSCNAPYGCGTVFKVDQNGQESVLYSFTGEPDGEFPTGNLVRDAAGNLYGTTFYGGGKACHGSFLPGCGTVFKVDQNGQETVLHKFTGGKQGAYPAGTLVRDETGNLYGTTHLGGDPTCNAPNRCGTVFKLTP